MYVWNEGNTYDLTIDIGITRIGLKCVISMLILSFSRAAAILVVLCRTLCMDAIGFIIVQLVLHASDALVANGTVATAFVINFGNSRNADVLGCSLDFVCVRLSNKSLNRSLIVLQRLVSTNSFVFLLAFFNRNHEPKRFKQCGQHKVFASMDSFMQIKQKRCWHGNNTGSTKINEHFKQK